MSVAVVDDLVASDRRALLSALFAVHRRVVVRLEDGAQGPEFCTCGDVWPCRSEEIAASVLDSPQLSGR